MRVAADLAWQALRPGVRVFRLPGIYGPGRSPLDRVAAGQARRIDLPEQVFRRVHVDDIAAGVIASFESGEGGIYNLADNQNGRASLRGRVWKYRLISGVTVTIKK